MTHSFSSIAETFLARAHVPYSDRPEAAIAILSDGQWVPGVRVENASFSLSLAAPINAVTSALAAGRTDVVGLLVVGHGTLEADYVTGVLGGDWTYHGKGGLVRSAAGTFPSPLGMLNLIVETGSIGPLDTARALADRAVVPESSFPVSAVIDLGDGRGVPGVNVEHSDWTRILCAERNALGTWVTLGRPPASGLHLSCRKDPSGTPCGACRQWLVELVRDIPVVMDRGDAEPARTHPDSLLPGAFTGRTLRPEN